MAQQRGFDFGGIHVLAAADDQVRPPGVYDQPPAFVDRAQIARAETAPQRRLSQVSEHQGRSAHLDFSVVDADLDAGQRPSRRRSVSVAQSLGGHLRGCLR